MGKEGQDHGGNAALRARISADGAGLIISGDFTNKELNRPVTPDGAMRCPCIPNPRHTNSAGQDPMGRYIAASPQRAARMVYFLDEITMADTVADMAATSTS